MSLIEWDLPRTYPTLGELHCIVGGILFLRLALIVTTVSPLGLLLYSDLNLIYFVTRAGFFHDGGPMHTGLERVLMCYVCYRPDVGYVQVLPIFCKSLCLSTSTHLPVSVSSTTKSQHPMEKIILFALILYLFPSTSAPFLLLGHELHCGYIIIVHG